MNSMQHTELIWTIENFLTPKECEELIRMSETIGYQEAEVSLPGGAKMMKGLRNNYRLIYENAHLADRYWQRLKAFCPEVIEESLAVGLNEQFRFYKYESDQRFKRHVDGRFKRNEREESRITFMIYLNEDFAGGRKGTGPQTHPISVRTRPVVLPRNTRLAGGAGADKNNPRHPAGRRSRHCPSPALGHCQSPRRVAGLADDWSG